MSAVQLWLLVFYFCLSSHLSASHIIWSDDLDEGNDGKWIEYGNVSQIYDSNYCPSSQNCWKIVPNASITKTVSIANYLNFSLIFGLTIIANNNSAKDDNYCAVYYQFDQDVHIQMLANYTFDSHNPFNNKLPFESYALASNESIKEYAWLNITFGNIRTSNLSQISCYIDQVSLIANDKLTSPSSSPSDDSSFMTDTKYVIIIAVAILIISILLCTQWVIFSKYKKMKLKLNRIESKVIDRTVSSLSIDPVLSNLNAETQSGQSPSETNGKSPIPINREAAKSYSDEMDDENYQFIDNNNQNISTYNNQSEEEIHINTNTTGRATFKLNNILEEVLDDQAIDDDDDGDDDDDDAKDIMTEINTSTHTLPSFNKQVSHDVALNRMRSESGATLPLTGYDLFDEDVDKKTTTNTSNPPMKIQDADSYASSIIPTPPNFGDDMSYSQRTKNEPHSLSFADPGQTVVLKNRYPPAPTKTISADISVTDHTNVRFKDEPTISFFESSICHEHESNNKLKVRYGGHGGHDEEHSLEIESSATKRHHIDDDDHKDDENSLELPLESEANNSDYDESVNAENVFLPSITPQRMGSYNVYSQQNVLTMPSLSPHSTQVTSVQSVEEISLGMSSSNQL